MLTLRRTLRHNIAGFALVLTATTLWAAEAVYVPIEAGSFVSALPDKTATPVGTNLAIVTGAKLEAGTAIKLDAFAIRETPVSNVEFLTFVRQHPEWRRDKVPSAFADQSYLDRWNAPDELGGSADAWAPVTGVSWFAAAAYCDAERARLPSWYEWEYVAAADTERADARNDPEWRTQILAWYGKPGSERLGHVGGQSNFYGVKNMHGLIWEWVDDFNALMISPDSRNQGDPDKLQFCGAGAISLQDRSNYAILMRVALLSSLRGRDTTANLGFRCARDL